MERTSTGIGSLHLVIPSSRPYTISRNPIMNASGKMNFFSPPQNFTYTNFSPRLNLVTFPSPNFLCFTVLPTCNVSSRSFNSFSVCDALSREQASVLGTSDPCPRED